MNKFSTKFFLLRKKLNPFSYLALLTVFALVYSCSKDSSQLTKPDIVDTNFVSNSDAKDFARTRVVFHNNHSAKKMTAGDDRNLTNETLHITEVGEEKPSFYIINYAKGGFVIIAGDKRLDPILAFSETNSFNLDTSAISSGLVGWLGSVDKMIVDLRNGVVKTDSQTVTKNKTMWNKKQIMAFDPDPDPGQFANCTQEGLYSSESTEKGPYLSTSWGQTGGYNNNSPNIGCASGQLPPTGCVATSMAQIMRYYQKPLSYDWSSMINDWPTSETARLMRDIGIAVNMDYECDGSSAVSSKTSNAFVNNFGYTSAQYQDYNYQVVVSEINASRPVILTGGRNDGWWIFGRYSDGHAWVCDGFMQVRNYQCRKTYTPYSPNPILMKQEISTSLYLHMNWGWRGVNDAYYAFNNFNPGTNTFNYKPGMVTNIRP